MGSASVTASVMGNPWLWCLTVLTLGSRTVSSSPVTTKQMKVDSLSENQVIDLALGIGQILEASDMTPEELAGLLTEAAEVHEKKKIMEYDYNIAVNDEEDSLIEGVGEDEETLYYPEEEEAKDEEMDFLATTGEEEKNIDDQEIEEDTEEGGDIEEDIEEGGNTEDNEEGEHYDYNLSVNHPEDAEYVEMVDSTATRFQELKQNRKVLELVIMAVVALTCLLIMFGLVSLATSMVRNRNRTIIAHIPPQVRKTTCPGGIIRQYNRLPVEVRTILPSHLAYRQLYETE